MTSHKKPGVAFWATVVVVVVLVGYPLSIGPAIWLYDREMIPDWGHSFYGFFYKPVWWAAWHSEVCRRSVFLVYEFLARTPTDLTFRHFIPHAAALSRTLWCLLAAKSK